MLRILYTTADVRGAMRTLMASRSARRVAISAFVGEGAPEYLVRPRGVELYCWLKPGATNAKVLEALKKVQGTGVNKSERLHMKLYWAQGRGCVMTSANLSRALGSRDLKEIGVWLPADAVDIDRVIQSLRAKRVTDADIATLAKKNQELQAKIGARALVAEAATFPTWYQSWRRSPGLDPWILCPVEGHIKKLPKRVVSSVRETFGVRAAHDWLGGYRGVVRKNDRVLTIMVGSRRRPSPSWLYADHIVGDFVIQPHRPSHYGREPFKIDNRFRLVLREALARVSRGKSFSWNRRGLPNQLLEEVNRLY